MTIATAPDRLESIVADRIAQGWRLESRTPTIAVLARGKRPNHLLHLVLSLLTFGLWVFVWMTVASWAGVRRCTIRLQDNGAVYEELQRPGPLRTWPPIRRLIP